VLHGRKGSIRTYALNSLYVMPHQAIASRTICSKTVTILPASWSTLVYSTTEGLKSGIRYVGMGVEVTVFRAVRFLVIEG
jgi:hypothetical protein